MSYQLFKKDKLFWDENKFLKVTNLLSNEQKRNLSKWCAHLEALPETPRKWMKYFESGSQKKLCRIENFLDYEQNFFEIAAGENTISLVSQLMEEKALLFKEKINVKYPQSSGFSAHQDAPAFIGFNQKYHVTMMVAIDDSIIENGCLRVIKSNPYKDITLDQEKDGSIKVEIAKKLDWIPIECKAGDVLLFDSYLPHYSKTNNSNRSRRAAFITYSRASEGKSMRKEYFADKRDKFPQDCEKIPGKDYSKGAEIYNVANPIE
ncbi:phytanoyl-CoA dioxygenase [Francisella halioticida]|uniref:Phytanoyl-CoA dioxygenase n=1 Tax=Francisella halioticida TaxID=549298 RepID=A0ABM6LY05_9GAMM|nr:phytanoyl-CoA dioxygenase family protein [Francisella halioticida]ASG67439.1 phytanoyl-CoA dioxygenase [Francisella halioticida]